MKDLREISSVNGFFGLYPLLFPKHLHNDNGYKYPVNFKEQTILIFPFTLVLQPPVLLPQHQQQQQPLVLLPQHPLQQPQHLQPLQRVPPTVLVLPLMECSEVTR